MACFICDMIVNLRDTSVVGVNLHDPRKIHYFTGLDSNFSPETELPVSYCHTECYYKKIWFSKKIFLKTLSEKLILISYFNIIILKI